jgi:hypothetical protein
VNNPGGEGETRLAWPASSSSDVNAQPLGVVFVRKRDTLTTSAGVRIQHAAAATRSKPSPTALRSRALKKGDGRRSRAATLNLAQKSAPRQTAESAAGDTLNHLALPDDGSNGCVLTAPERES